MSEISVITPSLNSAGVIADCLRSVVQQDSQVEHIVVDGLSSDGTIDVIRESGIEVNVLEEPPTGIYPAINAGIRAASGSIVGVLNADDFYASPSILQQVRAVFDELGVDACYGDLCYVDREETTNVLRYWKAGPFRPERFLSGWMPPHPTFFLRRGIYEKHGLYRTDLGTAADYELMLRMLYKHRVSVAYLPQVLVHMRAGGASNASLGARLAANRMDREAWRVNGVRPYPWTLAAKPLRKVSQWWRRP